jgi:Tol biopolymer transport system component
MEDQAAFAPDGKSIAFVSTYSGNADIYLLPFQPTKTVPITAAQNLTHHPAGDFRPAFSPDGHKLAFTSDRDLPVNAISPIIRLRSGDIYVLDLVSKQLHRLTDAPGWDGSPAWSHDGKTIAFYSQRGMNPTFRDTQARIWAMNSDGTNQRLPTPNETTALSPKFVPDGRIIYSRKNKNGTWEIVSIQDDGSGEKVESDASKNNYWEPGPGPSAGTFVAHGTAPDVPGLPAGYDYAPIASLGEGPFLVSSAPFRKTLPDREIDLYPLRYFSAVVNPRRNLVLLSDPGLLELAISKIDGSDRLKLFQLPPGNTGTAPSWSRDGEKILFTRGSAARRLDSQADVWEMRWDGTAMRNLTPNSPGNNSFASFSGDEKQIAFRSTRDGHPDIYLKDADGTNIRRLTNDASNKLFPVLSPTSNQVAFVSNRDNPETNVYEVYLLDFKDDGSPGQLRRITHNDVQEGHLAFSYDGKWLIFPSEQGGINDEEPLVQSIIFGGQS